MTPLTLTSPVLHDPEVLRATIDALLRRGYETIPELTAEKLDRLPPEERPAAIINRNDERAQAAPSDDEMRNLLSPAERVEWVLSECRHSMFGARFHIWVQSWCLEGRQDGPAVLAAIAEAARPLDNLCADVLRWTALRGLWARTRERPDAMASIVPEVWIGVEARMREFLRAISSRWPVDVDPFSLPAPAPWQRAPRSGPITVPQYPHLRREGIIATTAHALWLGGASDDELDAFLFDAGDDLPGALATYRQIDPLIHRAA